ncbi:GntR family transcriptional regulator [Mangrovicella endophytica]|uniref:GntR family transcriptional regulator n=1 Tax=Mangrovicella endophytica TaxID=2066697 RepID=UPI000C9DDE33|nr:GntR family transcriptional regulator [Mangrovicella endophytica]
MSRTQRAPSTGGSAWPDPLSPDALPTRSGVAATQRVFAILLQRILTFDLKPFDEISEGGLAEQMGVSRTPVREALARLAKLQLVDIFPQRGTVVAPLRVRDLKRSQFLRESLEWGLLRRALRAPMRLALVHALNDEIAVQRTLAGIGDEARFYASDELFHRRIASAAGLPDIWPDISDAKLHMDRFRHLMLASVETLPVIVEQHECIVAALEAADRDAAESALKTHLRRIFAFLGPAYEAHPDYFQKAEFELVGPAWFDD